MIPSSSFIRAGYFLLLETPEQIITTSPYVTPKCSLAGESPQNALNSGLGTIEICPETWQPGGGPGPLHSPSCLFEIVGLLCQFLLPWTHPNGL